MARVSKTWRGALLALTLVVMAGTAVAAPDVLDRAGKPVGALSGNWLDAPPASDCYFSNGSPGCDDAACEATVCAIDSFCCNVSWDSICADEAVDLCPVFDWPDPPESAPGLARILVYKDFVDDNEQEVDVQVSCNSGLPLEQDYSISEGEIVIFVLENFEDGVPDCVVTETVPNGYTPTYYNQDSETSPDNCTFEAVPDGAAYACYILNAPDPVPVEIEAVWEFDGTEVDIPEIASGSLFCDPVGGGTFSWSWGIEGDTTFTANVIPYWDGGTECSVSYNVFDSAVESSGCENALLVEIGEDGPSCTIVFTTFFEGIPTVNRYGLAVLALLMLGIGFVGFRRFV